MSIHRIFLPDLSLSIEAGSIIRIGGDEARHAARVKRLKVGESVAIHNGAGVVADGAVEDISPSSRAELAIQIGRIQEVPRFKTRLVLATAVPKGPHADLLVEQLSQLGVTIWIPLLTERSIVNPRLGKIEKWRRACIESLKQCGRAYLMEVKEPTPFEKAFLSIFANDDETMLLVADQNGGAFPSSPAHLDQIENAPFQRASSLAVFIGPEGGLTDEEMNLARNEYNARAVSLGRHTLRIETAAVAAAAIAGGVLQAQSVADQPY